MVRILILSITKITNLFDHETFELYVNYFRNSNIQQPQQPHMQQQLQDNSSQPELQKQYQQ